ncbi:hypothetical protein VV867_27830 [Pseudomonas sp. JH-2]|uniref:hypothetical protein n=1 Tax=Pseudomonas sp. JH-2 TaxID=3114998 RepID=UPI002E25656D|nr:hypothetical protein [Pseudomonas sp. JH-2]
MISWNTEIEKLLSFSLNRTLQVAFYCLILVLVACTIIPFAPSFPVLGQDPSWHFGMLAATAERLSLGRELIFTFGPYSSLYTKVYHPQTDTQTLVAGVTLAVSLSLLIILRFSNYAPLARTLHILLLLILLRGSPDSLFFSIPLLLCLSVTQANSTGKRLVFVFCCLTLGLLPLIKGSLLPLCVASILLCLGYSILKRNHAMALGIITTPLLAALAFWSSAGQSPFGLIEYTLNLMPIISGYSNSMASYGAETQIIYYLACSAALLVAIATVEKKSQSLKILPFLSVALYLFISFKAGFVRYDHAHIAFDALLIALVLTSDVANKKLWYITAGVTAILTYNFGAWGARSFTLTPYLSALQGAIERVRQPDRLYEGYKARMLELSALSPLEVKPGTSDIYSFDQSQLLASGNRWSPRPIFQSYSVYTPELVRINERHLRGENAPDNIFFKVQPIDRHYPSLEDGLSWPTLLQLYSPSAFQGDMLTLVRNKQRPDEAPVLRLVGEQRVRLASWASVPREKIVFAKIILRPSLAGKVAALLLKSSELKITVSLRNGETRDFRFIAGMGETGFILSPLVEDTFDFLTLSTQEGSYLDHKQVTGLSISPVSQGFLWQDAYDLQFYALELPPSTVPKASFFSETLAIAPSEVRLAPCETSVDLIAGKAPSQVRMTISKTLTIAGWNIVSSQQGLAPQQIFTTLEDKHGNTLFFLNKKVARADVKSFFGHPEMDDVGFQANIDISGLQGDYVLGIARRTNSGIEKCQQVAFPLEIKN